MADLGIGANRKFLLLWSGSVASLVGFHGVRIAYPLLVLAVTGSAAAAGWIGFALSVPSLLFQSYAGMVADGPNRLRTLLRCQLIGLIATCMTVTAVAAHLPGLRLILTAAAFAEGAVYVFASLAELGLVRDLVTRAQRPAAFSFLEAEQPIALLIGRAVGAAVFSAARWLPFAANAASYLYCIGVLRVIARGTPNPGQSTPPTDRSAVRRIAEGVDITWTEPFLRLSTALTGLSNVVIQVVLLLIMVELKDSGHPAWTAGVVLGTAGVGGLLGATAAAWLTERFSPHQIFQGAFWAWTALLTPIAVSSNLLVLAVCWCGVGGIGVVSSVALTVYRADAVPEDVLGRAMATMALVFDGAVAVGALTAGYLLTTLGVVPTRWTVLVAMLTLAMYASTQVERRPREPLDY
ncbi:MFS transporter [Nocardia gamkensis]|uniref:MFS transporter n=1 Tax=Nocardia gamkensis TaxID=352869 RepID=UPI0037CBD6C3